MQETLSVMFTHGMVYVATGVVASLALVLGASRCAKFRFQLPLLLVAIVVLWLGLFLSADSGYRAWQGMPDAPQEAFSDSGVMVILLLGWLPGLVLLPAMLMVIRRLLPLAKPSAEG